MAFTPRFAVQNRIQSRLTALIATSMVNSLPPGFLRDQLRTKVFRFQPGWTFSADNNKIDWTRGGGTFSATITAAYYGPGAEVATEVQTRMQAADGGATYTVTYDVTTHVLTIACNLSIVLKVTDGANLTTTAYRSLGFTANKTGTSNVADTASYQSTHFIRADLGSALSTQVGIVINHNAGTGGTFTLQGNATDAWSAPTLAQVLAGDADIRIAFFATQTLRWRRLIVDDVANAAGYSELGIWYDGPYVEVQKFQSEYSSTPEELSSTAFSMDGSHVQDRRSIRDVQHLIWKVTNPQLALIESVRDATSVGTNFFFAKDPVGAPNDTLYCYRPVAMPKAALGSHQLWTQQMSVAKAL